MFRHFIHEEIALSVAAQVRPTCWTGQNEAIIVTLDMIPGARATIVRTWEGQGAKRREGSLRIDLGTASPEKIRGSPPKAPKELRLAPRHGKAPR